MENNRIVVEAVDDGFLITVEIYVEGEAEPQVWVKAAESIASATAKVKDDLARIRK